MATRTFLFVDQVGSTEQLTRLGDAVAHQVRRALFDTLRQATAVAGGHEVDFTGDGLFCAFDGAAEAVDAAVAMQQLVHSFNTRRPESHSLAIRIGMHAGEPLVSESGGYFGTAVVVAARLCTQAQPGQILTSDLVRALVEPRGVHVFGAVGALALKGVPEPVESFTVAWTPDERRAQLPPLLAAHRTTPFVGRARELAAVVDTWNRLAADERRLVLVSGDHGMGVTRLLAEAAAGLRERGASVWAGAGQGQQSRLAAWSEAIATWAAATPRAELRLAAGERASDLLRLAPGLAGLLPGLAGSTPMDPATEVFVIADAVDELATRWSSIEPLVIVLDRLEEADAATLTVLRRLVGSTRGGRVLVLAGYEPAAVGASRTLAALSDLDTVTDVRLAGLAHDEVAQLVSAVTGEAVGEGSLRAVIAESEGSPYFVLGMARALKERSITGHVRRAVDRAGEARSDLRLQREEITLALRQLEQLREPTAADDGAVLDPDGTPPVPGEPPYRGLLAFRTEDAELFFGRDALVAEMVARLVSSRWLAVIGPSGSGKSSAVRAGLLPALAGGALPGSDMWCPTVFTPGPDPVAALAAALVPQRPESDGDALGRRLATQSLATVAAETTRDGPLLLVVDQFEELWTAASVEARTRLIDLLVQATVDPEAGVLVVVCMRADYYGRAAEHAALATVVADSQVLVPPMSTAELRAVVEQPARRGGWMLEPGLAQAVVDDVEGEAGALPLLSTAMLETWERRRGRSLTLSAYAETGGARKAIATLADATVDELPSDQQEVARRLLLRLAAPAADGGDVARPAPLTELAVDADTSAVLARLADRRLVTVGATTAQVAHEALLREWPRLRGWLEADRDGRRLHQQIATAATEWTASGRDDDGLLRGARLAAADDWRADHEPDLTDLEREFLRASVRSRQRRFRRLQAVTGALVILLVGALVAGVLAVVNGRDATARATESLARGLAAQAVALAPRELETALLLAAEAHRRHDSPDTRYGLLGTLDAGRHLRSYRREVPAGVVQSAVAPEAGVLAVAASTGQIRVFDARTWEQRAPVVDAGMRLNALGISPDGEHLAVAVGRGVYMVDVGSSDLGEPVIDLPATSVQFSPDGLLLVATTFDADELSELDMSVTVIDVASRSVRTELSSVGEEAIVRMRPGHDEMVVADSLAGRLRRVGLGGGARPEVPAGVPNADLGSMSDLVYSPDGDQLVVLTLDRQIHILDAETFHPVTIEPGFPGPIDLAGNATVMNLAQSPSGERFAVGNLDGTVDVVSQFGFVEARLTGLVGGRAQALWLDDSRLLAITAAVIVEYDMDD